MLLYLHNFTWLMYVVLPLVILGVVFMAVRNKQRGR